MVKHMTMIVVNVHEAKAKLSEYLEAVAGGQRVLICKRNQPVAELRAVAAARTEPRPVGIARGRLVVPDAFFAPLPDAIVAAFEGGKDASVRASARDDVARPRGRRKTAPSPSDAGRRPRRRS